MDTHTSVPQDVEFSKPWITDTLWPIKHEEDYMVRLRVKEILTQKNISMGRLSRMSDVSFNTIRRICNEPSYSPTLNTLVSIAKALGVTVDDLYEDVPDDLHKEKPKS